VVSICHSRPSQGQEAGRPPPLHAGNALRSTLRRVLPDHPRGSPASRPHPRPRSPRHPAPPQRAPAALDRPSSILVEKQQAERRLATGRCYPTGAGRAGEMERYMHEFIKRDFGKTQNLIKGYSLWTIT